MGLIIPMPFTVKRKIFTFISESPIVAKLQYGMKVSTAYKTMIDSRPAKANRL